MKNTSCRSLHQDIITPIMSNAKIYCVLYLIIGTVGVSSRWYSSSIFLIRLIRMSLKPALPASNPRVIQFLCFLHKFSKSKFSVRSSSNFLIHSLTQFKTIDRYFLLVEGDYSTWLQVAGLQDHATSPGSSIKVASDRKPQFVIGGFCNWIRRQLASSGPHYPIV